MYQILDRKCTEYEMSQTKAKIHDIGKEQLFIMIRSEINLLHKQI